MSSIPRYLFVTGKLAEPSLRRVLADLAPKGGFEAEVAVLPITVAALLTPIGSPGIFRFPDRSNASCFPLLPGRTCSIAGSGGTIVERGPKDLRDLPEHFGKHRGKPEGYGRFDIEILAEINHAPSLSLAEILRLARHYRDNGADVIDVGCNPARPGTALPMP